MCHIFSLLFLCAYPLIFVCHILCSESFSTTHEVVKFQDFYEAIDKTYLLEFLREFLTHEEADVRSKTCSAIGNMCRYSSYFYNSLVLAPSCVIDLSGYHLS